MTEIAPGVLMVRARQHGKRAGATLARAPLTVPEATARGAHRTLRAVKAWTLADEYRESSRAAGTWHKDAHAHRDMQRENVKLLLIALAVLLTGLALIWFLTPGYVKLAVVGSFWLYLLLKGRRHPDAVRGRKSTGLGALTKSDMTAALLAAGVIKKDQQIDVPVPPHSADRGWAFTIDLPAGVTAASAQKARVRLASALGLDEAGLVLGGVRGNGGHAARLSVWATHGDPWERPSEAHPLLDEERANAWRSNPVGVDARGRVISLRLPGSHVLIGAAPNAGKTFAGRSLVLPYALDPDVRLLIANGKGDDAWEAMAEAADTYVRGDDDADVLALSRMLDALTADIRSRNRRKTGSALTEAQARDADARMPLTLLVIDEAQEYLGCASADPDSDDKKATLGKSIATKLIKLAKLARSAGLVIVVLTQRPSEESLPKDLRAVLMTRLALRTRDRHNSDMILGPEFSARGYCTAPNEEGADDGLPNGVGILVPDPGADPDAPKGYPTLRTYLVTDDDWIRVGRRATALRQGRAPAVLHGVDPCRDEQGDGGVDLSKPAAGPPAPRGPVLDENVIALREFLTRPGNEFRATFELQAALGIRDARDLAKMMRALGLESRRDYIYDSVAGRKRQVAGYYASQTLAAIEEMEARMDAEMGDGDLMAG